MTTLVIAPGNDVYHDCVFNLLVLETGEHLASHFCSNYSFAPGDLYYRREERIKEYTQRFGDVEVKFINESGVTETELLRRNKLWYESLPKEKKQPQE